MNRFQHCTLCLPRIFELSEAKLDKNDGVILQRLRINRGVIWAGIPYFGSEPGRMKLFFGIPAAEYPRCLAGMLFEKTMKIYGILET